MKKILLFLMAVFTLSACHRQKPTPVTEPIDRIINVDEFISADNADMASKYENYVWYETQVVLNNFLDEEYEGVAEVTNVFQVTTGDGTSYDTKVIMYTHNTSEDHVEEINSFWVEDFPLLEVELGYEQALAQLNAVNCIKPHSRQVCLRREIGPLPCNAQWVFGNTHKQLYIDALDGRFRENSPAFPLGQSKWPQ